MLSYNINSCTESECKWPVLNQDSNATHIHWSNALASSAYALHHLIDICAVMKYFIVDMTQSNDYAFIKSVYHDISAIGKSYATLTIHE